MHPAGVHGNQPGRILHPSARGALQPWRPEAVYPTVTEHDDGRENFEHLVPPTA
jgi:hypothetical protein